MKCLFCEDIGMIDIMKVNIDLAQNDKNKIEFETILCPECTENITGVEH